MAEKTKHNYDESKIKALSSLEPRHEVSKRTLEGVRGAQSRGLFFVS